MARRYTQNISWDLISVMLILVLGALQIPRWIVLPQFVDIYYHILTAWGFVQAGGYSGWDFWQYAPVGSIHIYPPVFHLVIAAFMKLGVNATVLAKGFDTVMPVAFLVVVWNFVRKCYDSRLAFFTVVALNSSFYFFLSLSNHIPGTMAAIFGFFALEGIFRKKLLRAFIFLTLAFYTHIGVSWFFALTLAFYCLYDREYARLGSTVFAAALILAFPVLLRQAEGMRFFSVFGPGLMEKYNCKIKIIEYFLAFYGCAVVFRKKGRYGLFLCFLASSLIFLPYPYRFFSAEGYIPVIFLMGVCLSDLYQKAKAKLAYPEYVAIAAVLLLITVSPTLILDRQWKRDKQRYRVDLVDTVFSGLFGFKNTTTMWFPAEYASGAALIRGNSGNSDIIYSTSNFAGMAFACIAARATANGLFVEIGPAKQFDPIAVSRVIIFTALNDPAAIEKIVARHHLERIGENKLFIFYRNPSVQARMEVRRASVPFWAIGGAAILCVLVLLRG